ncbi:hypothetical protein DFJ73DRAFT_836753 [Zopfochytrium polystomum]|nr:hypothetical protein DFJ73DRAFT_836753 [Zopfochytrium polystomum]
MSKSSVKLLHRQLVNPVNFTRWMDYVEGHFASKQASAAVRVRLAHKVAAVPAVPATDTTAAIPAVPEHFKFWSANPPAGYDESEVMHITHEYVPNNPEYVGYWTFSDDVNVFPGTYNQNRAGMLHIYNHISETLEHKISGIKFVFQALGELKRSTSN